MILSYFKHSKNQSLVKNQQRNNYLIVYRKLEMKYPVVFKSVRISDETHKKLQSIEKIKETCEDVIKRLLENYTKEKNSLIRVMKRSGNRGMEINFVKETKSWTDKDYDLFVKNLFSMDETKWRENVLKRIAENEKWFEEILRHRNE